MDRPDFVIIKRKEVNRRMRIKMAKETRNSGPAVEDKNSEKPVFTLRGITLEIKAGKQLFFRNRREGGREVQIKLVPSCQDICFFTDSNCALSSLDLGLPRWR